MKQCIRCGSWAINHHAHDRDGSDGDLCDVCYWRKRAEVYVSDERMQWEHVARMLLGAKWSTSEWDNAVQGALELINRPR